MLGFTQRLYIPLTILYGMNSYDEENDGYTIYRPDNYYSDCLDMDEDLRD